MTDVTRVVIAGIDEASEVFARVSSSADRLRASWTKLAATMGVSIGVGVFGALLKAQIDAIAHFQDLAREAGTTASAISKFDAPARMAGLSLDNVAAAIFKMSQAALEARDPASKAAQALNAIGVSTTQLKGLKPDEMFELVARSVAKYSDGLEKNAVMQELFGKSGREMNRVVSEIAESGKLAATVTNEQAEAAQRFNNELVELKMNSEQFWRSLVSAGLPALNEILKSFLEGARAGGLYEAAIRGVTEALMQAKGYTLADQLSEVNKQINLARDGFGSLEEKTRQLFMTDADVAAEKAAKINDLLARRAQIQKEIFQTELMAQDKRAIEGPKAGLKYDPAARAREEAAARKAQADAARQAKEALEAYAASAQAVAAADEKMAEELSALLQIGDQRIKALDDEIELYKVETNAIGKTNVERELELLNYKRGIDLRVALNDAQRAGINLKYDELAALARNRAEVEAGIKAQQEYANAWGELADRVIGGIGHMRDALRSFAKELLAMFAKKYALQMIAGVTGSSALSTAASQVGANMLSGTVMNGVGSYVGGSLLGSSVVGAGATDAAFAGAVASGSTSVAASGIYEGITAVLADIPVYGWIALAVLAIAAYFSQQGGGPKGGGSFTGQFDASGGLTSSQFGARLYTPNNADPQVAALGQGIATSFFAALHSLGGTSSGVSFGIGFDTDPQGTAPNRITSQVRDAQGNLVFSDLNRDIGRDSDQIGPQLQLEAQRMLLAALQASDLPPAIAEILNGLVAASASSEQITATLQAAQAVANIIKALDKLGVTGLDINALKAMQRQGESLTDTFNKLIEAQASYYDLFFSEEEKKLKLQDDLLKQFTALGVVMPETRAGFRSLIEGLDLTKESDARLYRALLELAPAFAQLVPAVDAVTTAAKPGPAAPIGYSDEEWRRMNPDQARFNDYYSPEVRAARDAAAQLAKALDDARKSLVNYMSSLLTGDLSPLSPTEQLAASKKQFEDLLALAKGGDLNATQQLSGASDAYLRIAREIFASGGAYVDIFNQVIGQLGQVAGVEGDWQSKMVSALPASSTIASRNDILELTRALRDYLAAVSEGNEEAMDKQNDLLEELIDVVSTDVARR